MVGRSDYDCVGVGLLLAKYLADKFYRSDGDWRRGILLSIYLLEEVKRSVQFCGGESHVVLLNDDGRIMHVPDIFIKDAASVFNQASGTFNRLLMHALDLEKCDRELIEGFAQHYDVDLPQLVAFMKEFDSGVKKITTQRQRSASQGASS